MTTINKVQLTVQIPFDLKRKLNLCCAEQDIRIHEFIRIAIENSLKAYYEQKEKK